MIKNINYLVFCTVIFLSKNSHAVESYSFPLSTEINRANLYDYSISLELSKSFIALNYDKKNERFHNGEFISYVRTTIPKNSGDTFEYKYNVTEFTSSCVKTSTDTVTIDNFADLYIDNVHYPDIGDIPSFAFTNSLDLDFENSLNNFSLVTNQIIPSDEPLNCNGSITFNVELKL